MTMRSPMEERRPKEAGSVGIAGTRYTFYRRRCSRSGVMNGECPRANVLESASLLGKGVQVSGAKQKVA